MEETALILVVDTAFSEGRQPGSHLIQGRSYHEEILRLSVMDRLYLELNNKQTVYTCKYNKVSTIVHDRTNIRI